MRYSYCPKCGAKLIESKQSVHPTCSACSYIFYQNPVVGVAVIVLKDSKILLGKRNNSYKGKWCIPCGYVEWDEDVHQAAKREFWEETGLEVEIDKPYTVHSNFHNQEQQTVGIWFLAEVKGGDLQAADDLDEIGFFALDELPEMAFPTDILSLKELKEDGLL